MAKFELAIPIILKWEGGYVFNSADPGGETNMGITDSLDGKIDHLVDINGDKVGDVPIKALTPDQAKAVYKLIFWDRMLGDQFKSQNVANIVFDGYVNMGSNGIKVFQSALGVEQDGKVGQITVTQANFAPSKELFEKIKQGRIKYYQDLVTRKPTLSIFLKGWMRRIESFTFDEKLDKNV